MTSFIDDALKNITQALNKTGLYENTLIVYSSDNGMILQHLYSLNA